MAYAVQWWLFAGGGPGRLGHPGTPRTPGPARGRQGRQRREPRSGRPRLRRGRAGRRRRGERRLHHPVGRGDGRLAGFGLTPCTHSPGTVAHTVSHGSWAEDRVYVITGATRGLGFATAEQLVADGAKVVVSGRTDEAATEAAAQLGAGLGRRHRRRQRLPETAARLIETAKSRFGRFDGVLISVGGPPAGVPATNSPKSSGSPPSRRVFLGAVRLARTAVGELAKGGVIAFVLSGSVHEPIPGLTLSNGLRPGLAGFAKSLANETGPRGIRVSASAGPDRDRTAALPRLALGRRRRRARAQRGRDSAAPLRDARGVRPHGGLRPLPRRFVPHRRDAAGRRRCTARLLSTRRERRPRRTGRRTRTPEGRTPGHHTPARRVGVRYPASVRHASGITRHASADPLGTVPGRVHPDLGRQRAESGGDHGVLDRLRAQPVRLGARLCVSRQHQSDTGLRLGVGRSG